MIAFVSEWMENEFIRDKIHELFNSWETFGSGGMGGGGGVFFFPFVLFLGYRPNYNQRYENHETLKPQA